MSDTDWSQGWHYSGASGGQQGPVAATHLVGLHLRKTVRPEDQVWHPNLPDWCSLREAWPHLRPFKEAAKGRSSGRRPAKDYKVVEIIGSLSGEQVQKALMATAGEGWTFDQPIVIDPSRCLLVFKR